MTSAGRLEVETLSRGEPLRQVIGRLVVATSGPGFVEITEPVGRFVEGSGLTFGLATVFCRHTSASLTIQENASADVPRDLATALDRLAPRNAGWRHRDEGPDDMPAHVRTMLTDTSLAIPILDGRLALGTWQGLFLVEHRDAPHRRQVLVNLNGW